MQANVQTHIYTIQITAQVVTRFQKKYNAGRGAADQNSSTGCRLIALLYFEIVQQWFAALRNNSGLLPDSNSPVF